MAGLLADVGYVNIGSDDVVACHNHIIKTHCWTIQLWHNPTANIDGPQVNRILQKSLQLFPTLESTATADAVEFYERLQETASDHLLALMPFDAIMLWQDGFKDTSVPGRLPFVGCNGLILMDFPLYCRDGLYYCSSNVYTVDAVPIRPKVTLTICHGRYALTNRTQKIKSELWSLRLGSPGKHQLDILPSHTMGTPSMFAYHPFRFINFKEQAYIRKQLANRTATRLSTRGCEFFMDFGFMRALADDYKQPHMATDHIVVLFDGFCAYLAIVDGDSR
jgi:hypothetical protein